MQSDKNIRHILRSVLIYTLLLIALIIALDLYRAPDGRALQQTILTTTDGQQVNFANQSTPVILYFWGSWCVYCRHTSPMINKLHNDGYAVFTIAMQSGNRHEVQTYLDEHGWDFPVINDPNGEISNTFAVVATPTIAIIHNGRFSITTSGWTSQYGLKLRLWLLEIFAQ